MKTTKQIVEESQCEYDGWQESSFFNKKWYSEEEIREVMDKIIELEKLDSDFKEWYYILSKELFGDEDDKVEM
jgi:hypothetical protein